MKLKSLMNEYLIRENTHVQNLESLGILRKEEEFPCEIAGKSSWKEIEDTSIKSFSFSSRDALRSFCEYILDLESHSGILISFSISAENNDIEIRVPHRMLGVVNFRSLFNQIDNIHFDVIESFKYE